MKGNEPAFPAVDYISQDGKVNPSGLTKREYFAALAMQGLIASHDSPMRAVAAKDLGINEGDYDSAIHWSAWVALRARVHADALLAELSKEPS